MNQTTHIVNKRKQSKYGLLDNKDVTFSQYFSYLGRNFVKINEEKQQYSSGYICQKNLR